MIIDGRAVAKTIEEQLKSAIAKIEGRKPALAFVRVGDHPASLSYIRMKKQKCAEIGIRSIDRELPAEINQAKLLEEIAQLNRDPDIDGVLVQLPLPAHIQTHAILEAVDPTKDVDGFHPLNVGRMLIGENDGFFPCTPYGIIILLEHSLINPSGKHVVILGRSNIVGKPLAAMLMQKRAGCNATVTVAHSQTANLEAICASADILIAAMGSPLFVNERMVKKGAVVIDVGINRVGDKIVGDVDYEKVAPKCSAITTVPGGVGPMTIAMLMANTLLSYQRRMQ